MRGVGYRLGRWLTARGSTRATTTRSRPPSPRRRRSSGASAGASWRGAASRRWSCWSCSARPCTRRSRARSPAASVRAARGTGREPLVALLEGDRGATPATGPSRAVRVRRRQHAAVRVRRRQGNPVQLGRSPGRRPDGLPGDRGPGGGQVVDRRDRRPDRDPRARRAVPGPPAGPGRHRDPVPVRVLTREVVAQQDGNTYFLQVLQDRSTEVETLRRCSTVLVGGRRDRGRGRRRVRLRSTPSARSCRSATRWAPSATPSAASASSRPTRSHELRTPLTVIRSSRRARLQRHPERAGRAESREALDDIDAEVAHLTAMVDDLLLLARSDSGAVAIERMPVDLGDVAFDAASALGRTAEARGVRVRVDPEPAMLQGDPARLRQLVTILVDNAVRHSPRGGAVTVTGRDRRARRARSRSRDEGPGRCATEDMAHVFDRFWRAPGAPSGGTGLGLAIAALDRGPPRRPHRRREPRLGRRAVPRRAARPIRAAARPVPPPRPAAPGVRRPSRSPTARDRAGPRRARECYRLGILIAGPVRPVGRS